MIRKEDIMIDVEIPLDYAEHKLRHINEFTGRHDIAFKDIHFVTFTTRDEQKALLLPPRWQFVSDSSDVIMELAKVRQRIMYGANQEAKDGMPPDWLWTLHLAPEPLIPYLRKQIESRTKSDLAHYPYQQGYMRALKDLLEWCQEWNNPKPQ